MRYGTQELADTSDAAYEKRHRKYETFEKRQRLREKEKLKHEQYKLKERIEQLRGMDTAAFLALPAAAFSDPPGVAHDGPRAGEDGAATGIADLPGAHVNGAAAYNEAERRRVEMLEVAEALEERYRVLLPPDRKWAEKKEAERREKERARRASAGAQSVSADPDPEPSRRGGAHGHAHAHNQAHSRAHEPEPDEEDEDENEDEEDAEDEDADDVEPAPAPAPPRRPAHKHKHDSDGESEDDLEQRDRERSKGLKIRLRLPPGLIIPKREPGTPTTTTTTKKRTGAGTHQAHLSWTPDSLSLSASPSHRPHRGRGKPRGGDGRFLPKQKRHRADSEESAVPPVKRYKAAASSMSMSVSFSASASASASTSAAAGPGAHGHGHAHAKTHASPTTTAKTECLLLKAAERNAAVPSARKTQRHVLAFGVAVPEELGVVRDFEIPGWCWPADDDEEDEEEEEEEEEEDGDENELGDDAEGYWHAHTHGLNGDGPGSATPAFEPREHWSDGLQDSKDEFPVATLDDD
ncbi:hypothetical protein EIP86_007748 [Pleurotus ostreatoroseus]|nr:hypothetical protein EIP86_007748 [Pleurotus ostreatoroseus]